MQANSTTKTIVIKIPPKMNEAPRDAYSAAIWHSAKARCALREPGRDDYSHIDNDTGKVQPRSRRNTSGRRDVGRWNVGGKYQLVRPARLEEF